ncbi:MAG: putative TIM-barrel fold metal-dependent hydrolase [Clostridiales bacterium]|jgi:predicted TIM-barrel fold metal-dependent hydrolase|nr:putative TIM-barrel fold metal-dependent hydrolase [Clostridiales bacterium]
MIDAHAHLSNSDYGNIDLYLSQLKEAGVTQGIAVPGGMMDVRKMTDYVIGKAKPENPIPDNEYVLNCRKEHPEVIQGFLCIDPHAENALSTLEWGFKQGFKGLKLSPMSHQFSFASKAMANIVSACANYGFPVYSHVLFNPGATTVKFVELAKQFPKVNFILGHMGFGPADQDGLEAASKLNNFFLETSTGNFLHLKEAAKKAGPGKLIYGSEFPLSHPKAELEKVLLLNLSSDAKEKVLRKNIQELLRLNAKPDLKSQVQTNAGNYNKSGSAGVRK